MSNIYDKKSSPPCRTIDFAVVTVRNEAFCVRDILTMTALGSHLVRAGGVWPSRWKTRFMNVQLPHPPAFWIIQAKPTQHRSCCSLVGKGGRGINIELHPVKIQIYRRSTLTISGFNVIFILQFLQALCPSSTFRLWAEKERGHQANKYFIVRREESDFLHKCKSEKKCICGVKTGENLFISLFFLSYFC